ncbi:MAG: thioredoxin domain-containing protein [Salinivirgaceae bacterium]|nr:thioredoxin domain-containing protein [Salinivirgaceae bacterium]
MMALFTSCTHNKQQVVATVDDKQVTMQQIDALAHDQIFSLLENIYSIRRNVLDEYINQMIINAEAEKAGLSYAEYVETNVLSKITDSLIDSKIASLNGYVPDRNYFGRSYDCSTPAGRAYLVEGIRIDMMSQLADSLRQRHNIEITLRSPEPMRPKFDVSGLKINYKGNLKTEKSIVLVGSYACDGCKAAMPLFNELFELYGEKLKFGFCFYEGVPSVASLAAKAAERQGEFWTMHNMLMKADVEIDTAFALQCAQTLNLDTETFAADIALPELESEVAENIKNINDGGIAEEPSLVVGGRVFYAPFDLETIKAYIEKHLVK